METAVRARAAIPAAIVFIYRKTTGRPLTTMWENVRADDKRFPALHASIRCLPHCGCCRKRPMLLQYRRSARSLGFGWPYAAILKRK